MSRPSQKLQKKQQKESSETRLTCIDTNQGEMVYEYLNGVLGEIAARRFEEHLLLCFHCQDIVLSLDKVFDLLAENKELFFPRPGIEASKVLCRKTLNSKKARQTRS